MALVHASPFDVRDYDLDFRTVPAVVKAGEKAALRFRIMHPGTGEVVKKFEVVHERQYHLFLISQNMEYFQHIHPREQADGTWTIDVTLPMSAVDLRIRRAGLDIDPGYLPWFGRVVHFHYHVEGVA